MFNRLSPPGPLYYTLYIILNVSLVSFVISPPTAPFLAISVGTEKLIVANNYVRNADLHVNWLYL